MKKWALLLLIPSSILADGVVIPIPPRPRPHPLYLELEYHKVEATIEENVAVVEIEEVFINPHSETLEAEFIFPIPEGAAISSFALFVGDERLQGEVLEREEARRIYEDILRRKKDPALLEYYGQNLFRTRIFPISPGDERRILLTYEQVLGLRGGFIEFRYPLKIESLTSKPIGELAVMVEIGTEQPIKSIFSPSHEIDVVMRSENEVTMSYEKTEVRPTQDLVIYYSTSGEEFGVSLLAHRKDEGFFMVSLAPGVRTDDRGEPKDIAFVLDVSGSMAGDAKIGAAKRALEFFLYALDARDRFTIIPFSTDVTPWRETLVSADREGIDDATEFIRELKARGGTNISEAMTRALSFKRDDARPFYVAFLTDGRPTVGVTQLGGILELVEDALEGAKVFALGVGYNVNTHLIDKLTQVSRGVSEYVKPEEDLELIVSDFYSKLSHPALTDISIDFGEAGVYHSYPRILPDLFHGSQIVIIGKYCNAGPQTVVLKGLRRGREETFQRELQFPQVADFPSLPRLWAKRRVGYLLDEIRLHGEDQELVDEIVELGRRYGIVTPYTSFLVTEDELARAPDVISEKQALKAPTGRGAFRTAETLSKMKKDVLVFSEGEEALSIKVVAEKVFYLEDEVWVDAEYTQDSQEKVLILWSDEFIDFLRRHPEVGKFVSLGDEVVFTYGNVTYRVRP